jgi:hypothetical protein
MISEFDIDQAISDKEFLETRKTALADKDIIFQHLNEYLLREPTESELERFLTLIDLYQENPQLLDPYLNQMIAPMIDLLLSKMLVKDYNVEGSVHLFKILYRLSKTRGHKVIVKFFTHEASHLEPVIDFFVHVSSVSSYSRHWEMRFITLLWISLLCMIPFDLDRIDSMLGSEKLVDRVLNICKRYLTCVGKEYEGASILAMRLLTRKDCSKTHLVPFLHWQVAKLKAATDTFQLRGNLQCLAGLFKLARRDTLLEHVDLVWPVLEIGTYPQIKNNSLLRKLFAKLVSRIALICMKQRVASWRYHRGPRVLSRNLAAATPVVDEPSHVKEEDDYDDIPDELEDVVSILLGYLSDKDTIVRWTAAKGIGRICNRLNRDMADQVVDSILELLQEDTIIEDSIESSDVSITLDSTWHGCCLALAELTRRGLLLPKRLYDAIPWMMRALTYELKKGSFSLGSNVRDAACYFVWSVARAYEPSVIEPFAKRLSERLVVVALTDREIAVRRAASAAFQENAGRHGLFSHGIQIVTTADYFALGIRNHCFEHVLVDVAQFEEYRRSIVDHLVYFCCSHWDKTMRTLASKALGKLCAIYPSKECLETYLPDLIQMMTISDQHLHGGLLAVGEMVVGLAQAIPSFWEHHPDCLQLVLPLVPTLDHSKLEGIGSDLIRQGACNLIYCLSKSGILMHKNDNETFESWIALVTSTLERSEEELYVFGAKALSEILTQRSELMSQELFESYLQRLHPSGDRYARRGIAVALGYFPAPLLESHFGEIVRSLKEACRIQDQVHCNDAESRRNAVLALNSISQSVDMRLFENEKHHFSTILDCFLTGMEDYSVDSRGDVGSWIRDASMRGLETLLNIAKQNSDLLTESERLKAIGYILLSCSEKIDKIREVGGKIMERLLNDRSICIPHRDILELCFQRNDEFNWLLPKTVYPVISNVLHCAPYREQILKGIVVSIGGLTESLVRHSSDSLVSYLYTLPSNIHKDYPLTTVLDIFKAISKIFGANVQNERISIPILETLDLLLSSGFLDASIDNLVVQEIFETLKKEVWKSKNAKKLLAATKV